MATLLKVLDNLADIKSAGGVALGLGTQVLSNGRLTGDRRDVPATRPENPLMLPTFRYKAIDIGWPVKGRFGNYQAVGILSESSRSRVHLGYDLENHLSVIIKVVRRGVGLNIQDSCLVDALDNERVVQDTARRAGILVPTTIEVIRTDENGIIIFNDDELNNISEGRTEKRELLWALVYAVCALHKAGIAHNDISWRNALVNNKREIVLIDFGMAFFTNTYSATGLPRYFNDPLEWDRHRLVSCIAESVFDGTREILWPGRADEFIDALRTEGFIKCAAICAGILRGEFPNRTSISAVSTELVTTRKRHDIDVRRRVSDSIQWNSWVRSQVDRSLVALERFKSSTPGRSWVNASGFRGGFAAAEIGIGEAGIAYGLAVIATVTGSKKADYLARDTLSSLRNIVQSPVPGFIFGEGGVNFVKLILGTHMVTGHW
jgi:hypothetical protein